MSKNIKNSVSFINYDLDIQIKPQLTSDRFTYAPKTNRLTYKFNKKLVGDDILTPLIELADRVTSYNPSSTVRGRLFIRNNIIKLKICTNKKAGILPDEMPLIFNIEFNHNALGK